MLKTILLVAIFAVAVTDWLAVARGWKKSEYLAKPAVMVLLLGYIWLSGGFEALPLICFGLGLSFSLLGDIFLMVSFYQISERWFFLGLVFFLLAHVAYIVGLNIPFGGASPLLAIGIGVVLALTAVRILRRIVVGVRQKGLHRLIVPVVAYGVVITLMLLSALITLYRMDWKMSASGFVSLGAALFWFSDAVLAWNRFVRPVRNGRVINMVAYHLGQIALIAGAVIQFGG